MSRLKESYLYAGGHMTYSKDVEEHPFSQIRLVFMRTLLILSKFLWSVLMGKWHRSHFLPQNVDVSQSIIIVHHHLHILPPVACSVHSKCIDLTKRRWNWCRICCTTNYIQLIQLLLSWQTKIPRNISAILPNSFSHLLKQLIRGTQSQ